MLFAMLLSGVVLDAVVVSVTEVAESGVKLVTQLIDAPRAKLVTGGCGVQTVVAPAGAPVTVQAAVAAASGPAFVQVVVTDTGVPATMGTETGPVACMSANVVAATTTLGPGCSKSPDPACWNLQPLSV
ncbi:hypothetical protein [Diaphorobacter aerolatus]|uniref:Uncharacterized protein n=1 Tax=Diaphorobacter aerolatus TaxID=1288495 RepID=A0A7H0GI05_9BURK|nr:hypothetical protein [Diaphorobacter aerolatus]QNP47921.1 hypothetical protein H9K75_17620 [Diaphorobacter aerolatus]